MDELNKATTVIELVLVLVIVLYVVKGASALSNLFGGGDKVATIDPVTGLPICPCTGKPAVCPGRQLTPSGAAAITATTGEGAATGTTEATGNISGTATCPFQEGLD